MELKANVNTLTKIQQSKSIAKGKVNKFQKKKVTVKTILESPFSLEWPVFEPEVESNLIDIIKKSFSGLKKITFKPDWKSCQQFKGKEQKNFIKNQSDIMLKKALDLDPSLKSKMDNLDKIWSELVLGYNQVMRGLENGHLAGVILQKDTKPAHLPLTFVPACANQGIPLVPLDGLSDIVRNDSLLGLSHSCMVIGLRNSVKESSSYFNNLWCKMSTAFDVVEQSDSESDKEDLEEDEVESEKENSIESANVEVKVVYLKRESKSQRVFVPGRCTITKSVDNNDVSNKTTKEEQNSFIGFGNLTNTKLDITKPKKSNKKVSIRKSVTKSIELSNVDFNSMFIVDEDGMDNNTSLEASPKIDENTNIKQEKKLITKDQKRKASESRYFDYNSAKVKKVKSNPNRKDNK